MRFTLGMLKMLGPRGAAPGDAPRGNGWSKSFGAKRGFSGVLWIITLGTGGLSILNAAIAVATRAIQFFLPDLRRWTWNSALALILAGVSFTCFQFAASRARKQVALGLMIAVAFILWGIESFISNPALAAFIDDVVVFLFVVDLALVIYGHFDSKSDPL
jgi:hypothetical protein